MSTYLHGAFNRDSDCRLTLKRVCDMVRTHSQMHHADKYSAQSQHSSTQHNTAQSFGQLGYIVERSFTN